MEAAQRSGSHVASLIIRRQIRAPAARLFDAWTRPEQLKAWWGPRSVTCVGAQIDLRVGGGYRISHQVADGSALSISGTFQQIDPPRRLIYTWRREPGPSAFELVTVSFEPVGGATNVTVLHERIFDADARRTHDQGWKECLEALDVFAVRAIEAATGSAVR